MNDQFPSHASASSWVRRLRDGRFLVLSFTDSAPMPDGVNDAVVQTCILFGRARDETNNGRGKSYLDLLEEGWKPVVGGGVPLSDAMEMLGG